MRGTRAIAAVSSSSRMMVMRMPTTTYADRVKSLSSPSSLDSFVDTLDGPSKEEYTA